MLAGQNELKKDNRENTKGQHGKEEQHNSKKGAKDNRENVKRTTAATKEGQQDILKKDNRENIKGQRVGSPECE